VPLDVLARLAGDVLVAVVAGDARGRLLGGRRSGRRGGGLTTGLYRRGNRRDVAALAPQRRGGARGGGRGGRAPRRGRWCAPGRPAVPSLVRRRMTVSFKRSWTRFSWRSLSSARLTRATSSTSSEDMWFFTWMPMLCTLATMSLFSRPSSLASS